VKIIVEANDGSSMAWAPADEVTLTSQPYVLYGREGQQFTLTWFVPHPDDVACTCEHFRSAHHAERVIAGRHGYGPCGACLCDSYTAKASEVR
jgi:hypothetical protein